ncbi:hypothetical protein EXIGLDRAFT_721500 [Exidia glandulosa HHB12029]|uniref:Uncharacterized protein n=1 Tax=Exidia glandulosa HHB12029 TaxID=1314781 RepID=A0A165FR38_EXIGL|nr:hypothetical protein EXIGLDRAFT_721500 [Exidia glandulosa HHB12029]
MQRGKDDEDTPFDSGDIETITEACEKRNIEFRCGIAAHGSRGGAPVTDDNDDPDYLSNDSLEDDDEDDYYISDSSLSNDPDDADNGDGLF